MNKSRNRIIFLGFLQLSLSGGSYMNPDPSKAQTGVGNSYIGSQSVNGPQKTYYNVRPAGYGGESIHNAAKENENITNEDINL